MDAGNPFTTFDDIKTFGWSLALVLARLLPLFVLLPFAGRNLFPGLLRNGVAIGVGLVVAPMLMPAVAEASLGGLALIALILKEAFIGLMLGFLVALPFWAVEAAGFVIDNQRGASVAATINPMTGHDTSPLGIMLVQGFIAFFFIIGGFLVLLGMVYDSYLQWHPLHFWPQLDMAASELFMGQLNRLVVLALLLAAPVLVAMFLAELGLALVSRFTPQLQVFILAMPIKSGLAMLTLGLYVALMFEYTRPYIEEIGSWVRLLHLGPIGGEVR